MRARATIRFKFSSEKHLAALMNALIPEASRAATKRSKATLTRDDQFLVLAVEASDTVALRAALNAYLRWINSAVTVLETLEGKV
ncbi:MAG: KEOPS complex subunit Pcc1 [Candidatus Bathyarchaeia archaeon]